MKRQTIIKIYNDLNRDIFNNILTMPLIHATRSHDYAAYQEFYDRSPSIIEYSKKGIVGYKLATDIIYHEMCHQFLAEIVMINETDHHGPLFWKFYRKFARPEFSLFEDLD